MTLPQLAAIAVAAGLVALVLFQAALALGAPWGRAAYGGKHTGSLPGNLRVGSAIAVVIWSVSALVVLDRAGIPLVDLPDAYTHPIAFVLVPVLLFGALINFASSSPYERFGWGPLALLMALLTLFVALS